MTLEEIEKNNNEHIEKALCAYEDHLKKIQVGVINPDIFYNIQVVDKGKKNILKDVASIALVNDDTIEITPIGNISLQEIQKAINNYKKEIPLKYSVMNEKKKVVLKFDLTITTELRNIIVGICHKKMEEFRITLRNLRHDTLKKIKTIIKNDEEFKKQSKKFETAFEKANKFLDDKFKIKSHILLGE